MQFQQPAFLALLLLPLAWAVWYVWWQRPNALRLRLSHLSREARPRRHNLWMLLPRGLLLLGILSAVVALSRPQRTNAYIEEVASGINVMLALDISESMETRDLRPSRLAAAKNFGLDFLATLREDRCGLAVFAEGAYAYAPLTLDKQYLSTLLKGAETSLLPKQGTALGDVIGVCINRLRASQSRGGAIVLLTDGAGNTGRMPARSAADAAHQHGIRIYPVGFGQDTVRQRTARGGTQTVRTELNAKLLQEIAQRTGGAFLDGRSPEVLERLSRELDGIEKSIVGKRRRRRVVELYPWFVGGAAVSLCLALVLMGLGIYHPLESL